MFREIREIDEVGGDRHFRYLLSQAHRARDYKFIAALKALSPKEKNEVNQSLGKLWLGDKATGKREWTFGQVDNHCRLIRKEWHSKN